MESLEKLENDPPRRPLVFMTIPVLVLITLAIVLVGFYERELSQSSILTDIERVGAVKDIEIVLSDDKSGLRSVKVELIQGSKKALVFEKKYLRQGFLYNSGPERAEETFLLETAALKFKDGDATLVVTIRDYSWWNWMRGNLVEHSFSMNLDTRPPLLYINDSPRYIIPGGAGVVVYKINEEVTKHGVLVNDDFHPGFPLAYKGKGIYGAVIGLRFDTERLAKAVITATDLAGNSVVKPFGMILRSKDLKRDRINIPDSFLDRKLPEFLSYYPDIAEKEPLDQYLEINNRVRQENNATIREVCGKSKTERLWEGRFKRLSRSSRRAGFAEKRTYYYNGREIDKQVHLGIDLASTKRAEVTAANRGEVVFADYLGIYGHMVIVDHGLGVFSLYSHLSQMNVEVGDAVTGETVIALTGTSGMAGGDHLHFSMLVNGVFVNPLEWWDKQWLNRNILNFL